VGAVLRALRHLWGSEKRELLALGRGARSVARTPERVIKFPENDLRKSRFVSKISTLAKRSHEEGRPREVFHGSNRDPSRGLMRTTGRKEFSLFT
jgi:hypothetical protein